MTFIIISDCDSKERHIINFSNVLHYKFISIESKYSMEIVFNGG